MSASVNKVILVGRLGKDPEVRYTEGGQAVANFSLATDESYKDRSGERQKKTEWHNIVVWGKAVENFVQKYLHKGDMIYVEGKIQTRTWTDRENNKRSTTEINVTDIKALVTSNSESQNSKPATRSSNSPKPSAEQPEPEVYDNEDIPF